MPAGVSLRPDRYSRFWPDVAVVFSLGRQSRFSFRGTSDMVPVQLRAACGLATYVLGVPQSFPFDPCLINLPGLNTTVRLAGTWIFSMVLGLCAVRAEVVLVSKTPRRQKFSAQRLS